MKRKVLFLCTGNCCRSQMAEALLRHGCPERFEAWSAGSHPAGFVHPLAVEALERIGRFVGRQRRAGSERRKQASSALRSPGKPKPGVHPK